ncbi:hypothetical protein PENVUL_c041G04032 [Penicillium vulpinum]|uniref:Alpha-1,3-mannosyltransferase n=1 Tax=Penicillium vulpinum TaxID=29845 RepID=A0A1V6RIX3_9EURO|nr:hypothetical protein PENVUL_c041G04032 [Penicillium vulpinum]
MLPRHSLPLKEGRFTPSYPRSKVRARPKSIILRIARFIVAAVAGWLVISFLLPTSPASDAKSSNSVTDGFWKIWPTNIKTVELSGHDPRDGNPIVENPAGLQENVNATTNDQGSPQSIENTDRTNSKSLDPNFFDAALDHLLSTIPDEIYIRELLRPLTVTGEERLHELGLRTRAYKRFFEAWENVHLVDNDNHTYVRDDVIPYIRNKFSEPTFSEALHKYESYRQFLTKFTTLLFPWPSPYFADHMTLHVSSRYGGRGIVTTAGNDHAPFLLAAIPSFRLLGCNLPVEVMYLGDDDLSEEFRTRLEAIPGVTTRDLSAMVNDKGWRLKGWAGKPFAMLFSSFREVLFIDADSLFFVSPESLFDDPEYVRTGALFFRDRNIIPESKKEWLQKVLPKPISKSVRQSRMWTGESAHVQESGVVVVDKWKHFVALLLVCRMNGPDRDGDGANNVGTYDMVYGDKETFWIGWELAGDTSYAFHQGPAGVMGIAQTSDSPNSTKERPTLTSNAEIAVASVHDTSLTICAPQLLHLDREKRPLWFNGWLYENKFARTRVLGRFEMFMEEPSESSDSAWEMKESNLCCLSNSATNHFTKQEFEWLGELIEMAKTVNN